MPGGDCESTETTAGAVVRAADQRSAETSLGRGAAGVRVTGRGVDAVQAHVARFGPEALNEGMLLRLRGIVEGKVSPSAVDLNFYTHELRESVRYRRLGFPTGAGDNHELWNNAHTATLADYRLDVDLTLLYHPSVIK